MLAVEDLERGIADAIVIDEPVNETFADDRNVEVAFVFETGEEFGLGVRQEDEDLPEAINERLATIEEDSALDDLVAEWFGTRSSTRTTSSPLQNCPANAIQTSPTALPLERTNVSWDRPIGVLAPPVTSRYSQTSPIENNS